MKQLNPQVVNKLTSYFIQKLGVVPHRTGWLRQGLCPACNKVKKFGINLWIGRSNCFSCGYHPTPIVLLMKLEGFSIYNEAFTFLAAFEGADYLETRMPVMEQRDVVLPQSFTLLSFGESRLAKLARAYMKKRGYDIDELTMKGVGYCTKGTYAYRIIIPYYEKGRLVYFNARQFVMLGTKHKNPSMDDFGIGKAQLIYNVDAIHIYKQIYLLESATNCLTLGDRAVGTGGKIMSDYQKSKLLRAPCKRIVIILDPDATWEALRCALQLVNHKKVKVVILPNKYKGKENPDVNDIGRKETLKFVKATPYMNYSELFKLYTNQPKPTYWLPVA